MNMAGRVENVRCMCSHGSLRLFVLLIYIAMILMTRLDKYKVKEILNISIKIMSTMFVRIVLFLISDNCRNIDI